MPPGFASPRHFLTPEADPTPADEVHGSSESERPDAGLDARQQVEQSRVLTQPRLGVEGAAHPRAAEEESGEEGRFAEPAHERPPVRPGTGAAHPAGAGDRRQKAEESERREEEARGSVLTEEFEEMP